MPKIRIRGRRGSAAYVDVNKCRILGSGHNTDALPGTQEYVGIDLTMTLIKLPDGEYALVYYNEALTRKGGIEADILMPIEAMEVCEDHILLFLSPTRPQKRRRKSSTSKLNDLKAFAEANLQRNERTLILELILYKGKLPLVDVANRFGWITKETAKQSQVDYQNAWNGLQQRVNKKIEPLGLRIRSFNRVAIVESCIPTSKVRTPKRRRKNDTSAT